MHTQIFPSVLSQILRKICSGLYCIKYIFTRIINFSNQQLFFVSKKYKTVNFYFVSYFAKLFISKLKICTSKLKIFIYIQIKNIFATWRPVIKPSGHKAQFCFRIYERPWLGHKSRKYGQIADASWRIFATESLIKLQVNSVNIILNTQMVWIMYFEKFGELLNCLYWEYRKSSARFFIFSVRHVGYI